MKGVYHINAVDEVTQWQIVGATLLISEAWLKPAPERMLAQYPFRIRGFHSDNGSEFINYTVAGMLNKHKKRYRRGEQNAASQSQAVRQFRTTEEKRMTPEGCGNDGPAAPTRYRHGKVEIQRQDFHFPTAHYLLSTPKQERRSIPACYPRLQAHLWIRKRCTTDQPRRQTDCPTRNRRRIRRNEICVVRNI